MFDVPVLEIGQLSSQLEYEIVDGNGGTLGRASQVAGPKPRKGLLSLFGSGVGDSRVVVQVFLADGTPSCYIDRQGGSPVAVIAADGTLIGRFAEDRTGAAQQMAGHGVSGSVGRMLIGAMRPRLCHLLLDGADRPLARLDWAMRMSNVENDYRRWEPVACDYTDMNGVNIARLDLRAAMHKDRYRLQFHYRLPEPLWTLMIASPLAFDLTRS